MRHRFAAGALAALTQAAGLTALAGQSAAQAAPAGRVFHVDCAAAPQGSAGSRQHPWTALAEANAHTYGPGDRLLFRRGAVCTGTLAPLGTGAHRAPFTIADYGRSFDAAWSGPPPPGTPIHAARHERGRRGQHRNRAPAAPRVPPSPRPRTGPRTPGPGLCTGRAVPVAGSCGRAVSRATRTGLRFPAASRRAKRLPGVVDGQVRAPNGGNL